MSSKIIFITSTMFSRGNGPANFAMNLFSDSDLSNKILFYTTDCKYSYDNIVFVKKFFSFIKPIKMLMLSLDFYIKIRDDRKNIIIWNYSVLAFFSLLFLRKKKHIVFVNDSLSLDAKLKFTYRDIRLLVFRYLEKFVVKNSNIVIVNSKVISTKLIAEYNVNPSKVDVLYKGIKINEISTFKKSYEIDHKNVKIAFVKSDPIVGGIYLLCNALKKSNFYFELNIIGPNKIDENLFKIPNIKINLLGNLPKKILYETLVQNDIFFVPCLNEAFGQANIEAMYLKLPVLLLPIDYQKNLHNESYCYFSKDCSVQSVLENIEHVVKLSPNQRAKKANKAYNIVKSKYSFKKTKIEFKKYLDD